MVSKSSLPSTAAYKVKSKPLVHRTKDGVTLRVGLHNELFRSGKIKPTSLEDAMGALEVHFKKRVASF